MANLTNFASQALKFRSQLTWAPSGKWTLSGNVRYRDAENDELDWTKWDQNLTALGVNFWFAANHKFHFTVGADTQTQETDTAFVVPVMDG